MYWKLLSRNARRRVETALYYAGIAFLSFVGGTFILFSLALCVHLLTHLGAVSGLY